MNYEYWLANIPGVGNRTINRLLGFVGSAREIYELDEKQLDKISGIGERERSSLLAAKKMNFDKEYDKLKSMGISFVTAGEDEFPEKLRQIPDPPYALYRIGEPFDCGTKTVAIVGARACSEYGYLAAKEIGRKLAACNAVVVSGMARGIDSGGQWGAVKGGGRTYAVLGCGPDVCYPSSSRNLYAEILRTKGGIYSEYPPGTAPKPGYFPCRNRIIAGLADIVVVVEAKRRSGSLITADFALEQGKDIYAVPGRICDALSQGCNSLIYQGAGMISDVDEWIRELGLFGGAISKDKKIKNILLEKQENMVYCCLGCQPKNLETLLCETGLSMQEMAAILAALIQKELIIENFKNYYIRRL